jgi:hypothetical protein
MKRRAEYEFSLQEARESRQRYEQVSYSLRTQAVQLLENILKCAEEWLIAVGGGNNEEDLPKEVCFNFTLIFTRFPGRPNRQGSAENS